MNGWISRLLACSSQSIAGSFIKKQGWMSPEKYESAMSKNNPHMGTGCDIEDTV